jgi:hypothetical protein
MEKDALLDIILKDIREVDMLVQSFHGSSKVMPAFVNLTIQKVENIKQELELLQILANDGVPPVIASPSAAIVKNEVVPLADNQQLRERLVSPQQTKAAEPVSKSFENQDVLLSVDTTPVIEPEVDKTDLEMEPDKLLSASDNIKPVDVPKSSETKPFVEQPTHVAPSVIVVEHKSEVHIQHGHHAKKNASTLGESLVTDKNSVLDKLQASKETLNPALIGKTVDDIKKAIGINDRFLYQRELFEGNSALMNQTIDEINRMTSFAEAMGFIKANFGWDDQSETTQAFINIVRRKFK